MSDPGPRVLCIVGSPRRGGNSDRLLDAVMAGVSEAGANPVRLVAAQAGVEPCRGCGACSATGRCIVRDGMGAVYRELDRAWGIVVVTPVYFATVPAVLKALYDRCQPYWARRFVLGEPPVERKRPGAAIVVGGGGDPFGTACAVTPTRSVFGVLGVSLEHTLEVVGPDAATDVTGLPTELERAAEIGRSVATSGFAPPQP